MAELNAKNQQRIKEIISANKNYIPIEYEQYVKASKPLNRISTFESFSFILILICLIVIICISFLWFFFNSPEHTKRAIEILSIVVPIAALLVVLNSFLSRKNKQLFQQNNLVNIGDESDFVEITLYGYRNVKELCDRDEDFRAKIQEILEFRLSKILAFDYNQLCVDELLICYDKEVDEPYFAKKKKQIIDSIKIV
ncbi:hypothetical protein, partial [Acinetobacter nosocomialis]|uniref:hypothetical protein n=1 Tax=Acinetobacter nosocomialis TaxID=106654 RepID=UPI001F1E7C0C